MKIPDTITAKVREFRAKAEVINDTLWYVNPSDIEQALLDVRRETIEEVRIVALNVAEEISGLPELVNGFQHRGYATERQESEIYFEGFKDGRDMMRIDFSLPSGRFARRLREVLDNTPTV